MSELKAKSSGEIRARNALLGYWWYEKSEADKVIAELEKNLSEIQSQKMQLEDDVALLRRNNTELRDKCQMHDFFWEGCGFAKRGFKNTIAVSEAFDKLEAENAELRDKLRHYPMMAALIDSGNKEIRHQKYKRCLAMARWCNERIYRIERDYVFWQHGKDYAQDFYKKWYCRWLAIAEKFKPNNSTAQQGKG